MHALRDIVDHASRRKFTTLVEGEMPHGRSHWERCIFCAVQEGTWRRPSKFAAALCCEE